MRQLNSNQTWGAHSFLGVLLLFCEFAFAKDLPNIVFLLADDLATYSIGAYGNADVKTPHIDRLAKKGIAFDQHYDTTAICMASRASIMTGMYEYKTGCNFEHGALLRKHFEKSYPVLLRQAGYRTAMAGKIGFLVSKNPNEKGALPKTDFDCWAASGGQTFYETARNESIKHYAESYPHSTLAYGAFGRDFIKDSAKRNQPFCLSISFKAPHRPVSPDPKFDAIYRGKHFQKPANFGRSSGAHFSKQSRQGRQYARFSEWGYEDNYDRVMALYHQQVYGIDVAVGMIQDALSETKLDRNTIILFTSDNGFLCGSHGYGSKVLPYEESSRVPLIIYDPRNKQTAGMRCKSLTGNIDIAPTILAFAGLQIPQFIDGKSMLPLCKNPQLSIHNSISLINVWGPPAVHSLSIVSQNYKYIFWGYAESGFEVTEELYHLKKDRWELVNEIANPAHKSALQTLHASYDSAVAKWKKEAVHYHNYRRFGLLFDRHLSWQEKRAMLK